MRLAASSGLPGDGLAGLSALAPFSFYSKTECRATALLIHPIFSSAPVVTIVTSRSFSSHYQRREILTVSVRVLWPVQRVS